MTASSPAAAAPSAVVLAHRLYLVVAVLDLVSIVTSLVTLPQTIATTRQQVARQLQGQDTGGVDLDAVATAAAAGSTAIAVLFALAFGVLTIVFARKLLRGRNWARVVLLVFAALHLVGLVGLGAPGTPAIVVVLSVVQVLVAAAAAVLTFLPASRPWFRRTLLPPTSF